MNFTFDRSRAFCRTAVRVLGAERIFSCVFRLAVGNLEANGAVRLLRELDAVTFSERLAVLEPFDVRNGAIVVGVQLGLQMAWFSFLELGRLQTLGEGRVLGCLG